MKKTIILIAILLSLSNLRLIGQNSKFAIIDCIAQTPDTITQKLILFTNGTFVKNTESGSILQAKIPQEIGMERFDTKKSVIIVVQKIPTEDIGKFQIDPPKAKPTWIYILSIVVGGLMGGVFALLYKKDLFFGSGLGCVAGLLLVIFSGGGERVSITIDNSTSMNLAIHMKNVDDSIVLPRLSQVTVSMLEGERLVTVKNNDTVIESITIKLMSDSIKGKFVYNIGSNNSYFLIDGVYQKQ